PRIDGRAQAAHPRRAFARAVAAAGRGAVRVDPKNPRRRRRPGAGRAERGAEPRGGATGLYPRQWPLRARGKRRPDPRRPGAQARLPGYVSMAPTESLRARLARKPIVVAPGVYDPFTALLATQAGFSTLYVSGAAIAYTRLGRPDIGLVSMTEVTQTLALISDPVDAHLIVAAATGYGNALNVARTVREFERAGATAIQLEDQDFPKRCGHLDGKALVSAQEMAGKVRAAVDARHSADTLIVARTDAVAVEGIERAVERATLYREAGADVLFVEAPRTRDDLARIVGLLGNATPLLANMVEGGKTPTLPAAALEALGFAVVIFPGAIVRALAHMGAEFYGSLAANGSDEPHPTPPA